MYLERGVVSNSNSRFSSAAQRVNRTEVGEPGEREEQHQVQQHPLCSYLQAVVEGIHNSLTSVKAEVSHTERSGWAEGKTAVQCVFRGVLHTKYFVTCLRSSRKHNNHCFL